MTIGNAARVGARSACERPGPDMPGPTTVLRSTDMRASLLDLRRAGDGKFPARRWRLQPARPLGAGTFAERSRHYAEPALNRRSARSDPSRRTHADRSRRGAARL